MKPDSRWDNNIHIFAFLILLLGVIFIVFGPSWFIQSSHSSKYDFSETGNIGSTIGGITAPIIGLVTATLMYFAFFAQYRANKKQWETIINEQKEKSINVRLDILWRLYDEIKIDIRDKQFEPNIVNLRNGNRFENKFYDQIVYEIEPILKDIALFQDILLTEKKVNLIPNKYLLVFKYKLEPLTNMPFTIYRLMPKDHRSHTMKSYFKACQTLYKKIEDDVK